MFIFVNYIPAGSPKESNQRGARFGSVDRDPKIGIRRSGSENTLPDFTTVQEIRKAMEEFGPVTMVQVLVVRVQVLQYATGCCPPPSPPPPLPPPSGIGERYSQTISNLGHATLLRRWNSPYNQKCLSTGTVTLGGEGGPSS